MPQRLVLRVRAVLNVFAWLLPKSEMKNALLRQLGHQIASGVRVGPTIMLGDTTFHLETGVSIGAFNVFRQLRMVELEADAFIGGFNQFTAVPDYRAIDERAGKLHIKAGGGIINRHYLDCSGILQVGRMSMIGGLRSVFQTHELDLAENTTTVGAITLGDYSLTGTGVVMLQGAVLPDRSVLAAGSVLARAKDTQPLGTLYAGQPARPVKDISDWKWMQRTDVHTGVNEKSIARLIGP